MKQSSAKLFAADGHQFVLLPPEFRFEGSEVDIRRDETNGDVILSKKAPSGWRAFMRLRDGIDSTDGRLVERNDVEQKRDPFAEWPG